MGTYLNHGFVAEHKSGTKRTGKQGYTTVKQGYIRRLERRRLPCFFSERSIQGENVFLFNVSSFRRKKYMPDRMPEETPDRMSDRQFLNMYVIHTSGRYVRLLCQNNLSGWGSLEEK